MQFPKPVSKEFLQNFIEEIVYSRTPHDICRVDVAVSDDLTPHLIVVDTEDDDTIIVSITTDELEEKGEVVGWGFTPMITNKGMTFTLDEDSSVAERQYKYWLAVSKFAKAISELEIVPREWSDFENIYM